MATGSASRKGSTAKAENFAHVGSGSSQNKQERKEIAVNIRLQPEELKIIDALVARRLGRPKRHSWLLEAVQEKIERELDMEDIRIAEEQLLAIREGRSHAIPLEEVMRRHGNLEN
ncbi:MAG: hypothetical protein ABR907_07285 [Terracidiphilus sp.]|jgi:RHH-type rel operon transcriptional repressor/antitoxin RelB